MFRLTAALVFTVLVLLYAFFPLHHSRRALTVTFILLIAAWLVPVNMDAARFDGFLEHSQLSGLGLVPVIYGLGAHRKDGGEFISGGCVGGIHETKWKLVWD